MIDSKETGEGAIRLYDAQKRLLREVFAGLEKDIHWFTILKGRQLGCSTIVRALLIFWCFVHKGLRGCLVFDSDKNKEEAREEIALFLDRLPPSHSIRIKRHTKEFLQLENGSRLSYFVAGIKKTRSSGGLGRSLGVNVAGCTEMSSWADIEGLRSFERSLADAFPNRLFIWESTARGFNIFWNLWCEAKDDDLTKRAIFLGWWSKEVYAYTDQDTPENRELGIYRPQLFQRYAKEPPTEEEIKKIREVRSLYGHDVTLEQLAWYRHKHDPLQIDENREFAGQDVVQQELPWTEGEAFIRSGSSFFPSEKISDAMKATQGIKCKTYRYFMSQEFLATVIEPTKNNKHAHLKVWEEPDPLGVYVCGADPAHGGSARSDRHVAQVLRCYADGLDQVAEFCTNEIVDFQFAWALAHLCGAYKNARLLLELTGPGNAVWSEFRSLERLIKTGYLHEQARAMGMDDIFNNVRQYIYFRADSLAKQPSAFQWKSSSDRKETVMSRLRDFFHVGHLNIRSFEALEEMSKTERKADGSIEGEGSSHDDRVVALALAVRAWEDSERNALIARGETRLFVEKQRTMESGELFQMWTGSMVADFFGQQRAQRQREKAAIRRGTRWKW